MTQSKETRAIQHLLLQGFDVLPCYSAVCTLLVDRTQLDNPARLWAVICDRDSLTWITRLPETEPFREGLLDCATKASSGQQHVLCCLQGVLLVTELEPSGPARDARARLQGAIEQGQRPPVEKLEAFGDEAVEAEFRRRQRKKDKETQSRGN
jgi:hypothetical protein